MAGALGGGILGVASTGVAVSNAAPPDIAASYPGYEPLTVFAASSLVPLFDGIENTLESAGLPVLTHFAGSHFLAAQIRAGAPADLIITADLDHALRLYEASDLIAAPVELFANRLVLATTASSASRTQQFLDASRGDAEVGARPSVDTLLDRLRSGGRLLVADPAVPLGRYTQQWLDDSVERETMTPGERAAIRRGVVSYEDSARMVVAKLALGAADLAIVYASDARSIADEPRLRGRLELYPLRLDQEPRYYGAVPVSSSRQSRARALLDWLAGPEIDAIVEHLGFDRSGARVAR